MANGRPPASRVILSIPLDGYTPTAWKPGVSQHAAVREAVNTALTFPRRQGTMNVEEYQT